MHVVFNPPPGWPPPPPGWLPPAGWEAPEQWPPMPDDWVLYLETPSAHQHARSDPPGKEGRNYESWWGETGGYHAAYYAQAPLALTSVRRWGLDSWPTIRRSAGTTLTPPTPPKANRKWRKRFLYFAGIATILLALVPLVNNPVSRAIYACEEAVLYQARTTTTGSDEFSLAPDVPASGSFPASGFSRGNMRYTLAATGSTSLVTIVGDYVSPLGDWYTFNCTARHTPSPASVVEVTLTPLTPQPPTSAAE